MSKLTPFDGGLKNNNLNKTRKKIRKKIKKDKKIYHLDEMEKELEQFL